MSNGQSREVSGAQRKPGLMPSLNGGRAIAALLVFGGHFLSLQFSTPVGAAAVYDAHAQGRGLTDDILFNGFSAFVPVPINYFFILSGFVLAWAYRPGQSAIAFWIKRIGKVYPVYFVTTAIAFVLWGVLRDMWYGPGTVLAHVFLVQAWTPEQSTLMGLNVVMWTLSNEVFLYFLFPGLILMLTQFTKRGLQMTAAACVALSFLLPYLAGKMFVVRDGEVPQAPLEGFDNTFIYWFTLMFPPVRMFQFVLGICMALLMRKGIKYIPNLPTAGIIFAVGLTLTNLFLPVESRNLSGMMVPIAILILSMAKADLEGRWTPFLSRPLQFIGKISYSFYCVHILFILFTVVTQPNPAGHWDFIRVWLADRGLIDSPLAALPGWANLTLLAGYVAITTLAAWLLARYVEQPFSKFSREIANRVEKKKAEQNAAPPPAPPVDQVDHERTPVLVKQPS